MTSSVLVRAGYRDVLRDQPELGRVVELLEVGGLHHRHERRAA
jgi:hypothetical protein